MSHGSNQSIRNHRRHLAKKKLDNEKACEKAQSGRVNCQICNRPINEPFTNMKTVEFNGKPVIVHRECPGEEKV